MNPLSWLVQNKVEPQNPRAWVINCTPNTREAKGGREDRGQIEISKSSWSHVVRAGRYCAKGVVGMKGQELPASRLTRSRLERVWIALRRRVSVFQGRMGQWGAWVSGAHGSVGGKGEREGKATS